MWNNPLQNFTLSIAIMTALSLSACDNSEKSVVEEVSSKIATGTAPAKAPVQASSSSNAALDSTVDDVGGVPITYDVKEWDAGEVKSLKIDALDNIKSTFGQVVSTDENSLDYASNQATKYRFMQNHTPYLDLIDSQKYLELGWYYANPTDSDKEKALSQDHAKKAHQLARQLMADDGTTLLYDMLNGQVIKNKTIAGHKIELAKCEFYSCMLVLNKAKSGDSV